jgi:hypothetical protein
MRLGTMDADSVKKNSVASASLRAVRTSDRGEHDDANLRAGRTAYSLVPRRNGTGGIGGRPARLCKADHGAVQRGPSARRGGVRRGAPRGVPRAGAMADPAQARLCDDAGRRPGLSLPGSAGRSHTGSQAEQRRAVRPCNADGAGGPAAGRARRAHRRRGSATTRRSSRI